MASWRCPRITRSKIALAFVTFLLLLLISHLHNENTRLKENIKALKVLHQAQEALIKKLEHDTSELQTRNKPDEPSQDKPTQPIIHPNEEINKRVAASKQTKKSTVKLPRVFDAQKLSVVLYDKGGVKLPNSRLDRLRMMFPKSTFLWNDNKDSNLAHTLNKIIPNLKTEYFLFMEPNVLPSHRSHEGVELLWNALEKYPELDFIGGSYLSKNKFYVPCNRYRLCRWTFSESYEYARFLDNVMICDGISSSFMARTHSIQNISGAFDSKMPDVVVLKDFFFRAKNYNLTAGTRPSMMFLIPEFRSLHQLWMSREVLNELVPFAVKHKVFIFKDFEGNLIELCNPNSPLSGKDLCIERNSHKLMLGGGHWAYKGLYAYPYLYDYLVKTLLEVTDHLDRHNISYRLVGGMSLGSIKMQSVLPWDSGDVDIHVFAMTLKQIYKLFEPLKNEKGYIVRLMSDQVHVFCTPRNVGDLSGGIATIFPEKGPTPELMKIKVNGKWISTDRKLFEYLFRRYGEDKYLGHSMHGGREIMECKIKEHNACLPNFKSFLNGKGGTAREYFCEI